LKKEENPAAQWLPFQQLFTMEDTSSYIHMHTRKK